MKRYEKSFWGRNRLEVEMKISAFPKCWIEDISEGRMSLFEWIDISESLGCEGLELYPPFFTETSPAYLRRVRKAVEEKGMVVSMICYSPDFTVPYDEIPRQIERQREMIRITAELGGGFCRVLSGQKRPWLDTEEALKQVIYCIESCLAEAEKNGVVLAIENHFKDGYWQYPEFALKKEIFLRIVEAVDSPWFGVQYDPSNAIVAGDDPLELLDRVISRVKTVHASDRYIEDGYELSDVMISMATTGYPAYLKHGIVGKGLNNYPLIFEKLKSVGYSGWISIEDGVNGLEEMKESINYLKTMRDRYF